MSITNMTFQECKALTEQAPILIWRSNTTGACDYFNERWLSFTGRTMEQELGNGWAEGVHPDDLQPCIDIYMSSFRKQHSFEMEYRLRRQDGAFRWIRDCGTPFFDDNHTFAGFIGSCYDITDEVTAREVIRKQHESEITELRQLIPICCYCKKIRNDQGFWDAIEKYFSDHGKTVFTHGICPECMDKAEYEFNK